MVETLRTCVGCRSRDRQAALTRFVARDGCLAHDPGRALAGRGAYLHARKSCIDGFARRGGFVRSLRCVVARPERASARAWFPEVYD